MPTFVTHAGELELLGFEAEGWGNYRREFQWGVLQVLDLHDDDPKVIAHVQGTAHLWDCRDASHAVEVVRLLMAARGEAILFPV